MKNYFSFLIKGKLFLLGFTHSKSLKPEIYTSDSAHSILHDYGQPEYVAPEIVTSSPVTLNTDMWSVGVLAYVLLSGVSPFFGSHPKETLQHITQNKWAFTDAFNAVSLEAKDFIQRLFLVDPKQRMSVQQALGHPWIHYASQQTTSPLLDKHSLIQHHSRRVWAQSIKQAQPWTKLIKISKIMDDLDLADTGISSCSAEDLSDVAKDEKESQDNAEAAKKEIRGRSESFEDAKIKGKVLRFSSDDEETLNAGNYLLPVKDPFFTVRKLNLKNGKLN